MIFHDTDSRAEQQDKILMQGAIAQAAQKKAGPVQPYARFRNIPQLTQPGSWECGFPMNRLLQQIQTWQAEEGLDINPDFQRAHVWSEAQQIAWLEFAFRGGKTGRVLYFNKPSWNLVIPADQYDDFVLVDGKQRLEAIRRFYANEIRVFGRLKREFQDEPDGLRQAMMRVNVNDLPTRADVLKWYIDTNSGGTPHTAEEIDRVLGLLGREKARE